MSLNPDLLPLLADLVEAYRSVPRSERRPILAFQTVSSYNLMLSHPGIAKDHPGAYPADLRELQGEGMITVNLESNGARFIDVTQKGLDAYVSYRTRPGRPGPQVEKAVSQYVDSDQFRRRHTNALLKWERAADLLWKSDSSTDYSAIGHYCREAAQEFATSLLILYPVADAPIEIEKSKARVAAVLRTHATGSERIAAQASTLLAHWSSVIDLMQRQEHGSQKATDPLTWEDGRRVAFATLFSMTELDRLLIHSRPAA